MAVFFLFCECATQTCIQSKNWHNNKTNINTTKNKGETATSDIYLTITQFMWHDNEINPQLSHDGVYGAMWSVAMVVTHFA